MSKEHIGQIKNIIHHPSICCGSAKYSDLTSYLLGYEHAAGEKLFDGFTLWLCIRMESDAANVMWPLLALHLIMKRKYDYLALTEMSDFKLSREQEREATNQLAKLIEEFFNHRNVVGVEGIQREYREFHKKHSARFEKEAEELLTKAWGSEMEGHE